MFLEEQVSSRIFFENFHADHFEESLSRTNYFFLIKVTDQIIKGKYLGVKKAELNLRRFTESLKLGLADNYRVLL